MSSNNDGIQLPEPTADTTVNLADRYKRRSESRLVKRGDGICEAPSCGKPVPGGMVDLAKERYFCSKSCQRKEYLSRNVIGHCEHCGGEITGVNRRKRIARFCSRKCDTDSQIEALLASTGCFRSVVEEYLSTAEYSNERTWSAVRSSICAFFHHAVEVEGISRLEEITPKVADRFQRAEKSRGMTSSNWAPRVRGMFEWLIDNDLFSKGNPIRSRKYADAPRTRQPYEDAEIAHLWRIVEATNDTQLKLMFAIGEESGLRNSEVCNIRLEDINLVKQTIYVRLPTKNGEPRTVHFHKKVKKYLKQWLEERDPRCDHDHLFHTVLLTPAKWCLDTWFRSLYSKLPEPAASFEFHRLRHTWATRLVNAGMELPVLQQLGGWKSLRSVQIYAKIRKTTVDRQYEAAYAAIEQELEAVEEESVSLVDFALMNSVPKADPPESMT